MSPRLVSPQRPVCAVSWLGSCLHTSSTWEGLQAGQGQACHTVAYLGTISCQGWTLSAELLSVIVLPVCGNRMVSAGTSRGWDLLWQAPSLEQDTECQSSLHIIIIMLVMFILNNSAVNGQCKMIKSHQKRHWMYWRVLVNRPLSAVCLESWILNPKEADLHLWASYENLYQISNLLYIVM